MDEQPIRNPHGALFRGVFGDPRRAAELLRSVLPRDVIAAVDWSSLQRIDTSFVDEDLRDHQADLLFRARINGRTSYLYVLFEHKAGQARFTVFQLLRYAVRIWAQCRADDPSATHLPLVLPFVVHHGDSPWAAPRTLHELLTLMEQRFGRLPDSVVQRIENATSAELERWTLRLLTSATLSEMFA